MSDNWVTSYSNGLESVEDLDGVSWHRASVPRHFHCCRPQTRRMSATRSLNGVHVGLSGLIVSFG